MAGAISRFGIYASMKLSISTHLDYDFPGPSDVMLQLEAAILPEQRIERANIVLPPTDHFARLPGHKSIVDRICLRVQGNLNVQYEGIVEVQRLGADISQLSAVPPHLLPAETIEYLMPSRFCPSDEFHALVEADFGGYFGGARVAAMRDWIERSLDYVPGSSSAMTGAMETYISRKGVCRDFAHLLVTMVRASGIPARYASVYGPNVEPQDFHSVAEVFLDGTWYPVDATSMVTSQDMAKIGVGRDAADVSFLTSYGPAQLNEQTVSVAVLTE